jgi:hypothetical protein
MVLIVLTGSVRAVMTEERKFGGRSTREVSDPRLPYWLWNAQ